MEELKEKRPFWKNKYFKIAIFIVLTLIVPYLTIPVLLIWLFQKNQKISKKVKVITYALIGTLLAVFLAHSINAYSKDPEPTLEILNPKNNAEVQTDSIEIQGTYEPKDRTVWVNGKKIQAENGSFSSSVTLKKGENKIKIQAGNWKRATVNLTIVRVPTPEELAEQEAERKAEEERKTQERQKKADEKSRKQAEQKAREAQEEQKKAEEESRKQAEKKTQEEQKAEAEKPFVQKEVTEESVKSALASLKEASYRVMSEKEITKVEVSDDLAGISEDISEGKIITVYFKPETVWDEKDTLKMTAGTAVAVMRRLFAHPKIASVTVWVDGDFTDQYGKTETAKAALVQITKQTADKIEWDEFKNMVLVDYNKLFNIADAKYIHPAILKKI
jgi:hypothetical protein